MRKRWWFWGGALVLLLFGLIWSPKMTCWMALDSGATATTPSLALLPSELTQPNDLARVAQFQQDELPMLQYRDGVWRGARLGEGGIGAVLPVRVKGEPSLALLLTDGQVELVRLSK